MLERQNDVSNTHFPETNVFSFSLKLHSSWLKLATAHWLTELQIASFNGALSFICQSHSVLFMLHHLKSSLSKKKHCCVIFYKYFSVNVFHFQILVIGLVNNNQYAS